MYFYTVANMVGIDKINKWATLFGLGVECIDLQTRCRDWSCPQSKQRVRHEKWYAGEDLGGIGQGQCR